jgi:peptidoglycan hydrolase-like protein with peptidoglycan-binding domain
MSRDALHTGFMITSIALGLLTMGEGYTASQILYSRLATMGLEGLDAAVYATIDKDAYSAGIAAVFAVIGPLETVMGPLIKKLGAKVMQLVATKTPVKKWTEKELKLYAWAVRNVAKAAKLIRIEAATKLIKRAFTKIKTFKMLSNFINWLIKKGIVTAKFVKDLAIPTSAGFLTWDAIAAYYGVCNNAPMSKLSESEWKILKSLGFVGKYMQPFSTHCEKVEALKAVDQIRGTYNDLNERIKRGLSAELKNNRIYSINSEKSYNIYVAFIQYILMYENLNFIPGVNYNVKSWNLKIYNSETIKNVSVYNTGGKLLTTKNNENKQNTYTISLDKKIKGTIILRITYFDGTKITNKANIVDGNTYGQISTNKETTFNYGYYDNNTKIAVENYQRMKKIIPVDGIVGKNVLGSMLSDIESGKYKTIKNFKTLKLTEDEYKRMFEEAEILAKKNISQMDPKTADTDKKVKELNQQKFADTVAIITNQMDKYGYGNLIYDGIGDGEVMELDTFVKTIK